MTANISDRFWAKVEKTDSCWEWRAGRTYDGYGKFKTQGRTLGAHRIAYQLSVGPIPEGLQIDHLCRNRGCVRPDHLEAVTCRENALRSQSVAALNAVKTHCLNGHALAEYAFMDGSHRRCRICHNERSRLSMQRWRDRRKRAA